MADKKYIEVTEEQSKGFFGSQTTGEIVMLNLLKYKDIANYSEFPELKPLKEISGKCAYKIYSKHTIPLLDKAGSEVLFFGSVLDYLIGPSHEKWDEMLLVKHKNKEQFLKFATDVEYLKTKGHRTAALEDSRLIPIIQKKK